MGEQAPAPSTETQPAPLAAFGGLLTVKRTAFWYRGILEDETTDLPPEERFIAPANRGIGEPDELQKRANEELEGIYERLDRRKMLLIGHSLGGLSAARAALQRPDLVYGVVSLGGAHLGYSKETIATLGLRYLLGNPSEAQHLKHNSPFMQEHREEMASEWPAGVPFHIVASPNDVLVVTPHGFDVELPGNQAAEKRIVVPPSPLGLIEWAARRGLGIPDDVKPITTWRFCEHLNLPRVPAVREYAHEQRGVMAEVSTLDTQPIIDPLALPAAA